MRYADIADAPLCFHPPLTKITDAPFCFHTVLSRLCHRCGGGINGDRARGVRVGAPVTKMGFVFER